MNRLHFAAGALVALVSTHAAALTKPDLEDAAEVAALEVSFADPSTWNGEDIPKSMQCPRNGGRSPGSPELVVGNVPSSAKGLVVFFRNPRASHNHGLVKYSGTPNGKGEFIVPSVAHGATGNLPGGVAIFQGGTDTPSSQGAAFWAPCPSRGYWRYEITVFAVDHNDTVVAEKKIAWGGAP